jgi:hypothetical protein
MGKALERSVLCYQLSPIHRAALNTRDRRWSHITQALAVGDKLPSATLKFFNNEGNMKELTIEQLCKGALLILLVAVADLAC